MSKERDVAEQILQHIGGKENVVSAEHCACMIKDLWQRISIWISTRESFVVC